MKNFFKSMLLICMAASAIFLFGCEKKSGVSASASSKSSLPDLDTSNPKSVMVYYVACMARGEYEKAAGVAIKDGLQVVQEVKSRPDSKRSKAWIAAFKKIDNNLDGCLSKTENSGRRFEFDGVGPVEKIGVRMEGGEYFVYDL